MATELSRNAVIKTYALWAPVYDVVFGSVFEDARRMAVEASERVGRRILEVGVGTGISLPYYSTKSRVVGIDISEPMLKVARRRVIEERLDQVEQLEVMAGENLEFPESTFYASVAQDVVNTVPHPESSLYEFLRVLRPGGELVIVNRVGAAGGSRKALEHMFQPIAQRLGWRSKFPWMRFERWASRTPATYLIERRPVPPLGHFSLIRFGKLDAVGLAQHCRGIGSA